MKRILFYSSVKTKKMFSIQSYYRNDIQILKDLGYQVLLSNSVCNYFLFWKYDIGFFYFYRYSLLCAIIAKFFNKKTVFTGGIDYLEPSFATLKQRKIQEAFFKICNCFSNVNIIVSSTDEDNIRRIYHGRLPNKCIKSFHVIDFESFEYKGERKEKIFTTIAWMVNRDNVYRKGVDKTVKAFAEFVKLFPDYRLIIVGPSGVGSEEVLSLVSKLCIEKYVEYKGSISEEEKIQLLKKSMFYTQLSIYEGFGIAAIEALAAGNIVIHSGKGGLKDAVGNNGYIVNLFSTQDIVSTFRSVASKQGFMAEQRIKAIQYVKNNFSYMKRLQDFQKIFNKI